MSAGTPIVGPLTGGIAETVVDGETGLLVRPRDPKAFADATTCLFQNADLRIRLGAGGRQRSQERYTLSQHVERQIAIYEQVTGVRERAPQLRCEPLLASAAV
jgi:glycosyltransferase involved in cell wall biosynthesis